MSPDDSEPARDAGSGQDRDAEYENAEPSLSLPAALRSELKEPFGPVETDPEAVLETVSGPLIAVGDVVTYHLLRAGRPPDVALVDGRTKRSAVDDEIERAVTEGVGREVVNPPGLLTAALVRTLAEALDAEEPITIYVDGEEDLAALPAIVLAPDGASVVYGQPGEGMVHVRVDDAVRERVLSLLERFEGDAAVRELLED